jgi:hypothetical protein
MNLQANWLPLEFLLMVFICNLFGVMGYVRSIHYFDTLVITVAALLMEPIAAMLQAFLFGVGFLPGTMGWIGNAWLLVVRLLLSYQVLLVRMGHQEVISHNELFLTMKEAIHISSAYS